MKGGRGGGVKLTPDQEKLPSKSPALLGLKLITKLRLGLSHLQFHKFKNSFQDTLNPICSCGTVETIVH